MEFKSLLWPEGKVNPSGLKPLAYFIPRSAIKTWPTIKNEDATTIEEHVNYSGDFVLETGKKWFTMYSTQGKGKLTCESTGEKDCKLFTNKVTLSYPDINDEGRNMMKAFVNASVVMIIPAPGNRYHVIGSPDYDVEANITGDSGDTPGSAKGVTVEVTSYDVTPAPRYVGDLALEEGTLDCATGTLTA